MAESITPNPIPLYISGDASKSPQMYGGNITATSTDPDGADAVEIYRMEDPFYHALLVKVPIYSRGNNGAGTAYLWIDDQAFGSRECIDQVSWVSTDRGLVRDIDGNVVYLDLAKYHPDQERMRGQIIRRDTRLYVQITDGSMSDGYRCRPDVRDLTRIPDLANQD